MAKGQTSVVTEPANRTVVVSRVFDAPRTLVFKAFTTPEHLTRWWGPKGWTLPVCTVDFRPGGVWHYCMRGPTGEESWGRAIYREIVEPERIVYTDRFVDADGTPVEGMPEITVRLTFEEYDGTTTLTCRAQFATAADFEAILAMGMVQGLTETWDRLEEYLAKA